MGANRKAIIFTEYRATLGFLHKLLSDEYKTLAFDGSKSSDYAVIKRFESEAEILITTDVAAEGFNLAFCSFIVNYDLPYNTQTLEQRIMRCHRQGQQNDVVVLNFLTKTNIADVRTLELVNKRTAQFDGIVGGSDDVVGNFSDNAVDGLKSAFAQSRTKAEIDASFRETLTANEEPNTALVETAETALFTTFTREVADKVTVTPRYVKVKTAEINDKLWSLVKWFFAGKDGYATDDDTRTLHVDIRPQKVFTGVSLRKREYSMSDRTLTIIGTVARNVINETLWRGVPESGAIIVENLDFCAEICYYKVSVGATWQRVNFYAFLGQTDDGRALDDADCRALMALPVVRHSASGAVHGERDVEPPRHHPLDGLLDASVFIRRAATESEGGRNDEIARLTESARVRKAALTRDIEGLRREIRQLEIERSGAGIAEKVSAEKRKAAATGELKRREQTVFLDGLRIDADLEEQIGKLTADTPVTVTRLFAVKIEGGFDGR